jgi:hypothetical protein
MSGTKALTVWAVLLLAVIPGAIAQDGVPTAIPEDVQTTLDVLTGQGYLPEAAGELVVTVGVIEEVTEDDGVLLFEGVQARDVVIQADIMWSSQDRQDGCGFVVRYLDEANNQEVQFKRTGVLNFFTSIMSVRARDFWRFGSTFNLEDGDTNHLTVILNANQYTVLINGELVRDFAANRFREPDAGAVGVFASGNAACTFSNLWVWAFAGGEVPVREAAPDDDDIPADPDADDGGEATGEEGGEGEEVVCLPLTIEGLWEVTGGCVAGQALWNRAVYVRVSGGDGQSYDYYWGDELKLEGAGPEVGFSVVGHPEQDGIIDTVRVVSCEQAISQQLQVTRPDGGDACGQQ